MLEEIKKEELKITWDDEDDKIQASIERGKSELEGLTGTSLDFNINHPAKSLLFSYCRYDYNNALEYWEDNFHKQINRLILKEALKKDAIQEE